MTEMSVWQQLTQQARDGFRLTPEVGEVLLREIEYFRSRTQKRLERVKRLDKVDGVGESYASARSMRDILQAKVDGENNSCAWVFADQIAGLNEAEEAVHAALGVFREVEENNTQNISGTMP